MASRNHDPAMDKRLQRKAKAELHEEHVEAHLESFRRTVQSMKHIRFPCETDSLMPFLRQAKFVQSAAVARLDNFSTLRLSETQGIPKWFTYPPMEDPVVSHYLRDGVMFELGRTDEDVLMLLFRMPAWHLKYIGRKSIMRMVFMDLDRIILDPATQIAGCGIIFDMSGATHQKLVTGSTANDLKMEVKIIQDGYPLRLKHVVFYNEPSILDTLYKMLEGWISDKMRKRFIRVHKHISRAFEAIPGLERIMPPEYGGRGESVDVLIDRHQKAFEEFYSGPYPWDRIELHESLRPDSAKHYMRHYHPAVVNLGNSSRVDYDQ
ncbi:unnamed protein product [Calicophoron daubneyi]|uniref:CRAL-TRIO domain-containing protein n=1 Tax=Calicophoron daubneyi TaxID=300641 RepID=A0AAV2TSG9_CALDB